MFAGIVEAIGEILYLQEEADCLNLGIKSHTLLDDLKIGDSMSVNGVCLTITKLVDNQFHVIAVPETLMLTNLKTIFIGAKVNLERALTATTRIGGHYVQGHIDFCGKIIALEKYGAKALLAKITYPANFAKYIINKGYIAIDGMSITVIDVEAEWFSVTFIPHSQEVTIIQHYQVGSTVNIEVDIIGKYFEKMMRSYLHDGLQR